MADQTNAQIGSGTQLAYFAGAAYTTLGNIRSINGVGTVRAEVDSTTLESKAVERIPGIPDGKQVTILFTTGAAAGTIPTVRGFVDDGLDVDFRLTVPAPANDVLYFTLVPMDWQFTAIESTKVIEIQLIGRITGPVTTVNPH